MEQSGASTLKAASITVIPMHATGTRSGPCRGQGSSIIEVKRVDGGVWPTKEDAEAHGLDAGKSVGGPEVNPSAITAT
jgi:hypothetical protein